MIAVHWGTCGVERVVLIERHTPRNLGAFVNMKYLI